MQGRFTTVDFLMNVIPGAIFLLYFYLAVVFLYPNLPEELHLTGFAAGIIFIAISFVAGNFLQIFGKKAQDGEFKKKWGGGFPSVMMFFNDNKAGEDGKPVLNYFARNQLIEACIRLNFLDNDAGLGEVPVCHKDSDGEYCALDKAKNAAGYLRSFLENHEGSSRLLIIDNYFLLFRGLFPAFAFAAGCMFVVSYINLFLWLCPISLHRLNYLLGIDIPKTSGFWQIILPIIILLVSVYLRTLCKKRFNQYAINYAQSSQRLFIAILARESLQRIPDPVVPGPPDNP